jgi:pimeloyl-ACP methyl ester carboxylesterase
MPCPPPKSVGASRNKRLFRAAGREVRALLRLATLLPRDLTASVPREIADGENVAVLVHGSLATAGAWRPLRKRLEARRAHAVTFTYGPSFGVREIAAEIAAVLARIPVKAHVHLVGHSLGGLAVRWYVQEMPFDERVVQTISVAAPFAGARGAWFYPGPAGRDMQRGSDVLERLSSSALRPGVRHLSIVGTADTAVAADTVFPVGERFVIADAGHNTLLFDEAVVDRIVSEISASR